MVLSPRGVILKLHQWLGLTAGLFLVVLGLSGSVIAFEADIPHWLHPNLFYIRPEPHALSEQELIRIVVGNKENDPRIGAKLSRAHQA